MKCNLFEFKVFKTMPSWAEIYAKLLGVVQGPGIAVVSILQVPTRDSVMVLKAGVA
jgi:ribosomal protein L10